MNNLPWEYKIYCKRKNYKWENSAIKCAYNYNNRYIDLFTFL